MLDLKELRHQRGSLFEEEMAANKEVSVLAESRELLRNMTQGNWPIQVQKYKFDMYINLCFSEIN